MARERSQNSKLDELIRLQREQGGQIAAMQAKLNDTADQVSEMAPTFKRVAEALVFARVGNGVFRWLFGIGLVVVPALFWLTDRWALVAQLFKRIP